jgi:hypothetical protein
MNTPQRTFLTHASQLLTLRGDAGARREAQMRELCIIADGAVLIRGWPTYPSVWDMWGFSFDHSWCGCPILSPVVGERVGRTPPDFATISH